MKRTQEYYKEASAEDQNAEILAADLTTEIKAVGIEKTLTDRFGYIIFNTIFTENISKQIKPCSGLYKLLITKFAGDTRSMETLLNLAYLYVEAKDKEIKIFAPTILKYMMEEEIIDEDFLIKWVENKSEVMKHMEEHFLFTPARDLEFR